MTSRVAGSAAAPSPSPRLELETAYQLFDRAGVADVLAGHPHLRGVLADVRAKIAESFGPAACGLLDTVRTVDGQTPVGLVLLVQSTGGSDALFASFHMLLEWWHAGASRRARGRIAIGLAPPRAADNDNAIVGARERPGRTARALVESGSIRVCLPRRRAAGSTG